MKKYKATRVVLRKFEEEWEIELDNDEEPIDIDCDAVGTLVNETDEGIEEVVSFDFELLEETE